MSEAPQEGSEPSAGEAESMERSVQEVPSSRGRSPSSRGSQTPASLRSHSTHEQQAEVESVVTNGEYEVEEIDSSRATPAEPLTPSDRGCEPPSA